MYFTIFRICFHLALRIHPSPCSVASSDHHDRDMPCRSEPTVVNGAYNCVARLLVALDVGEACEEAPEWAYLTIHFRITR